MKVERLGEKPCWHRQQTGTYLDMVGVAGHPEKVFEHDLADLEERE